MEYAHEMNDHDVHGNDHCIIEMIDIPHTYSCPTRSRLGFRKMKINELSKQSGIHLETIRYYEKMGLMPEPKRLANGYRDYDEASLKQLKFIKTCRALDFSLAEIKFFNEMKTQQSQHCEVDSMLAKHLVSVEEKIAELTEIKHFLQSLITEDDHQAADCKAMAQLKAY